MIKDETVIVSVPLELFNTRVTPMKPSEVIDFLEHAVLAEKVSVIANHNLHSLYLLQVDQDFSSFYDDTDIILIDGFPVLRAASSSLKARGRRETLSPSHRVGSLDWVLKIGQAQNVRRLALVGSSPQANERAVARLQSLYPDLLVRGWNGQEWTNAREAAVLQELADYRAQVTLVALGMPLQESFIFRNREILPPGVYATVGGALDQLAGIQKGAPRWLGRFGLEWLWRFISQPRRLFHRYMVEPWKLLFVVMKRLMSSS